MKPHTCMSEVLEVIENVRRVDANLIVTLGGGSLIDGAKAIGFVSRYADILAPSAHEWLKLSNHDPWQALGNDVHTEADLMALPTISPTVSDPDIPVKTPKCPLICIPTTLSGGEFTPCAGVTRESDLQKVIFQPPETQGPELVILDADLAIATPLNIWIQTDVRAIDHCVEGFCSRKRIAQVDEACIKGLQRLIPALLLCNADPSNTHARQECQLIIPHAMTPLHHGVQPGASHGIGHQLGPLGVGHGETSCILLPSVCKWNARQKANVERQALLAECLWKIDGAREKFEARGPREEDSDLGDLMDAIVRELGMPRSLKEVGVGRNKFDDLARNALYDKCTRSNPAKIDRKEQILEILEMCA